MEPNRNRIHVHEYETFGEGPYWGWLRTFLVRQPISIWLEDLGITMKNIQYMYILCVLMIMLFLCTAKAVSADCLMPCHFVYNIAEEKAGKKTVAIFSYGYSGIVQGFHEPSNELVRVQIPVFEKLIIQDSTYTFFFPPIPPDTQTATLQLKNVVFEDEMYIKDVSLCEDFRVLTFTVNREKFPEEVMEIPSDAGWNYCDWYLPAILYREQTEEKCSKVFGTDEQRDANNEKPPIHLTELVGRPVNFQNLAESALYCYRHIDIICGENCFQPSVLWATEKRDIALVNALIKEGADVNKTDYIGGHTALQMAVWNHDTEIIRLLLEAGADVDVQESSWTPLIYAAFNGLTEIAQLLIEAGADLYAVNEQGENALTIAEKNGHQDIVKILREAMKK